MAETPKPLKSFPQWSFSFSMESQLIYNAKRIKSAASYYAALAGKKMGMSVGWMPQPNGTACSVFPTERRKQLSFRALQAQELIHCPSTLSTNRWPISSAYFCVHLMLSMARACLVPSGSGWQFWRVLRGHQLCWL